MVTEGKTEAGEKPKRKSKGPSPTEKSLELARKLGWMACVVEKRNPKTRTLVDAFGFGDILAVSPDVQGAIMIQATGDKGGDVQRRIRKIMTEPIADKEAEGYPGGRAPNVRRWLASGNRLYVWGWAKKGPAGKRKLWTRRSFEIVRDESSESGLAAIQEDL